MFERILVTTDGSDLSDLALDHAGELAQRMGAVLVVLHVVPDPGLPPFAGVPVDATALQRDLRLAGNGILSSACARLGAPKVRPVLREACGRRVAEVIAQVAEDEQVDLIVMGTHGRTGLNRALLGSVAEQVSHAARSAVLLVRRPAAKPSALEAGSAPGDHPARAWDPEP